MNVDTYTVVDPWTVMIYLKCTSVALSRMVIKDHTHSYF
jgi:hypothetical protein